MRLVSVSNISDSPEPLAPPRGRGIAACAGSVVGLPSLVNALFSGIATPFAKESFIFPSANALLEMSSMRQPFGPPGTAMEIGLVATPTELEPK